MGFLGSLGRSVDRGLRSVADNPAASFALGGMLGGQASMARGANRDRAPETSASAAYAAMTRDAWATYVQTFMPFENRLIEYATDQGVVPAAMQRAGATVDRVFGRQQGDAADRLRSMGMTLDADEQAAVDRGYGLARTLANVGAQNRARDVARTRQRSILGNPSPLGDA